jgi:hypothetical protein
MPPASRSVPPNVLHPEPPCQPLPRETLCPPLTPEFRKRRTTVEDAVQKITDVAKLQDVAQKLSVSTPVATKRCIKRDIFYYVSHICTDDKLKEMEQEMEQVMPGFGLNK